MGKVTMASKLKLLSFLFINSVLFLTISFNVSSEKDVHEDDIIVGNVICLLPDVKKGIVKPVIATEPCNGIGPHTHVILYTRTKVGNVYAVQGSPEALERLEKTTNRKDVKLKGKFSSNQSAWILSDDQ